MFLEIYPHHPGCPVSWRIIVHNIFFYTILCMSLLSIVILLFISDFIYLGPFSFFLMSLVKGLSILFIFSKNQLLDSLIFGIIFLDSISFISVLVFIISFLLLPLGFVHCSFSRPFKCEVRFFYLRFFLFFIFSDRPIML